MRAKLLALGIIIACIVAGFVVLEVEKRQEKEDKALMRRIKEIQAKGGFIIKPYKVKPTEVLQK